MRWRPSPPSPRTCSAARKFGSGLDVSCTGDYANRYPKTLKAFDVVANNEAFETFNSKVEAGLIRRDAATVTDLLKAEQLAGEIATQAKTFDDLNGLLRTLMKSALERMLDTERDVHLGRKTIAALPTDAAPSLGSPAPKNRRNGRSPKTVCGELGELTLDTPRDRDGAFEPQLIANINDASAALMTRS